MWRHIKRIFTFLMVFLIGWYVLETGVIQHIIPHIQSLLTEEEATEEEAVRYSFSLSKPIIPPDEIDRPLIRDAIFQLTNNLRQEQGAGALTQNEVLIEAADIRALETATNFSHTRPNGEAFHTVLTFAYDYQMAGENLAMGTYHGTDEEMATFLFNGWVDSEGHYKNMIEPEFTEIGIGVHYDNEMLYLVQIFGKPN